jgi:hypothetical protein
MTVEGVLIWINGRIGDLRWVSLDDRCDVAEAEWFPQTGRWKSRVDRLASYRSRVIFIEIFVSLE